MARTSRVARILVAASAGWAAALPLATFAASLSAPATPVYLFALAVYAAGAVVCHQLPARSFHMWGRQLPVCARCAGIYAGAAAAAIVLLVRRAGLQRGAVRARAPVLPHGRTVALAALAPTAATLVFEWTTGITPANWIRAAAGAILGAAIAGLVVYEVN